MPSTEKCKWRHAILTALNTIVMWGFISFKLPVPGLISFMICLIIDKFTAAQKQISSAFTHAYVWSKACATFKWPAQVFLLYGGTLTSTYCSTTLLLGRAWWGLFGTCTSCTGARNPVPGQQVAAINCCQTTQRGLGEFQPPSASKGSKLILCTGWEKLILCIGWLCPPTFGNYLAQRKRR